MTTLFEKIINRELPSTVHYEDDDLICIDDKFPQAPIHLLFITKEVIPSMHEMSEDQLALLPKIFRVIKDIAVKFGVEDAYRVLTNVGEQAGQTVPHLHFHLLAGSKLGSKGG